MKRLFSFGFGIALLCGMSALTLFTTAVHAQPPKKTPAPGGTEVRDHRSDAPGGKQVRDHRSDAPDLDNNLPPSSKGGKAAKNYLDWKLLGGGNQVTSGTRFTLFNITDDGSVRYGKRKYGINLVWDNSTKTNAIRFDKKGGGVVNYGDVVAIHVLNGGHLHYQKRSIGVNLVWSTPPTYEWIIVGGVKGTPVKTNTPIGLFNQKENDFMIYGQRPVGINLRWWKDRELSGGWSERAKHAAGDLAKKGFKELAKRYLP